MNITKNFYRLILIAAALTAASAKSLVLEKPSYLSALENSVLEELNFARMNPKTYAKLLQDYRATFNGKIAKRPGKIDLMTSEGTRAVDEAIAALNKQAPLPAMRPSKGMSKGAMDHVKDIGPKGITGHNGSDGSKPFDRINRYGQWQQTAGENISFGNDEGRAVLIQLIVDDAVANRGHRKNIYKPEFNRVGIACGPHKVYGTMCVQTFAGEYVEK
ncbi:MAG: CAP domain-containing protein [Spirochaetes bacterium]|nr:CAP domain-containing protein [Spirochaetota bacterium]MBX3722905.1 CAP domain-containing protein [Turneriella sp.]